MLLHLNKLLRAVNLLLVVYCCVGFVLLFWPLTGWLLLLVGWLAWKHRKRHRPTDLGSARWADTPDLMEAGMLGATTGLILGRVPRPKRRLLGRRSIVREGDPLVRLPKAVHVAIFGPTGSGKNVSFVLPTLLTNDESCVVLDFKGELARETAEHRRKRFGHRVVLLDPFHAVTAKPDSYNPLDGILKDHPLALDDANDLAAAVVVRTGKEQETHWVESAEACIAAVTATVIAYGEANTRSFQNVREILSHPQSFAMAIQLMTDSDAWGGALARLGAQLLHLEGKEKASVLSSTLRHLRFLGTPAVSASTATSTFDPTELRRGKLTVYCILPPDRAIAQAGLLRLWVSSMIRACVRGGLQ